MAPTECLLSACLLDCLPASLLACLSVCLFADHFFGWMGRGDPKTFLLISPFGENTPSSCRVGGGGQLGDSQIHTVILGVGVPNSISHHHFPSPFPIPILNPSLSCLTIFNVSLNHLECNL